MSLCTPCCGVFARVDEDSSEFQWEEEPPFQPDQMPTTAQPRLIHLSWDSFCDSIDQNCPICWAVWRKLRSSPLVSWRGETYQHFFTWLNNAQGSMLHMTVVLPTKEKKRIHLKVFRTTKGRFEAEARFLEGDLFCEATFTTVKNWLDQCPEAHPKCRSREKLNPNPGTVPTRLLDTHGSQAKTWSLIETSHTIPASSDYVALSHRWSKDTPKLENANRSQYQTPQLDGLLPRTYQDVFTLCRALDIRYVWIDSLCIIQDSVEDFEREVATMMSVYMNALCTFSVCWEYPNAGLSFYRKPKTFLCWPETYMATTGPKTHAFVRDIMDWEEAVDSAPVNTRGWVFQERLLSPRILYLGNDVLFWECDDFLTSEMAPGRSVFSRINIAAELGDLARQWPYLVSAFMRKDLSYEKDRLFAISGIAQLFAQRTSETFLAGLRKTCWAHDLLWHPRPFSSSENRSPSAAMPSWSWATCPAPLDWPTSFEMDCASSYSDFKPEVNILGHLSARSLEAFGCNIYGKPGSASLDISGLLIPARYEEFNDETGASNARIEWLQYPHNPQYTRVKSDGFFFSTSHPKKDRRGPSLISLSIGERTSEHTDFSLSCFVLPLLEKSESNLFDDPEVTDHPMGDYRFFDLHALIIQERPRNSADIEETERIEFKEYVRIGTLTLTLKGYYKDSPAWLNEYRAYRGIINGIWEQLLKHDSDASEADGANEDMEFDTGLWQFVRARNDELSSIVKGKMSADQADVKVQANWATIRLV